MRKVCLAPPAPLNQISAVFQLGHLSLLDPRPLLDEWLANVFSYSVGCLFTFVSFVEQKLIGLINPICLFSVIWGSISERLLSVLKVTPVFSNSFMVWGLWCSLTWFLCDERWGLVYCFVYKFPHFPSSFTKNCPSSNVGFGCFCQWLVSYRLWNYFWVLCSIGMHVCALMLAPCCFAYFFFVVCFEI